MSTQIGAQMYTLHEHTKTVSGAAEACAKVKKMGYDAIQASAFGAEVTTEELVKICDGEGLEIAATHRSMDQLRDIDKVVEEHQMMKCSYTALGSFQSADSLSADWIKFAAEFAQLAGELKKRGLHVGYHNHSHEWARLDNGQRAIDILCEKLAGSAWFELDMYWVAHAGGEPTQWIKQIAAAGEDMLPCVHFKDMAISSKREQMMCEVGSGNLSWDSILESCKAAGVRWYLVERDSGELDPYDSLRISLENMHEMGLK